MAETTTELEYVPRELFDVHIENIRERATSDKELTTERIDRLQAVMEKNFALLDEKIEHAIDSLTIAINANDKRIEDVRQSQNLWFTVFGIIFAVASIVVPVILTFIK